MNPPTEQLIRDYLNRLSVAARSRLAFVDRQTLLNQTRSRIEARCGDPASASVAEVKKALAELGDPVALVDAAHSRISAPEAAAVGGSSPAALPAGGSGTDGGDAAEAGGRRGGHQLVRLRSFVPLRPFVPRPAPPQDGDQPPEPSGVPPSNGTGGTAQEASGGVSARDSRLRGIGARAFVPGFRRAADGTPSSRSRPEAARSPIARSRRVAGAAVTVASRLGRFGLGLASMARRHKLETLAVLLLGVGGVIFPPVWLLGALLAVTSQVWDIRDKWIGLALPLLGILIGTALVLVVGGQQISLSSYAYEAWLGAGRLSRVLAVLGAVYLLWRLRLGPRKPRQPPWNVPRKLDL